MLNLISIINCSYICRVYMFFLWVYCWPCEAFFISLCALSGKLTVNISVVWTEGILDALCSILAAMCIQGWFVTFVKILYCGIRYVHPRLICHFREDFILSSSLYASKVDLPFSWRFYVVVSAMCIQGWFTTFVKILYCGIRYVHLRLIYHFREKNVYCDRFQLQSMLIPRLYEKNKCKP